MAAISTAIVLSAGSMGLLSEDAKRLFGEGLWTVGDHEDDGNKGKGKGHSLSVEEINGLRFGITAGDHELSGAVTINPVTGAKTVSGGAHDFGGLIWPAQFRVEGRRNEQVYILLPSSVNVTFLGRRMTVTNFAHDCPNPCVLASNGRRDFHVGGQLNLAPNQPRGFYHGHLTVVVQYAD